MTQYLAAAAMARSGLGLREIENFLASRQASRKQDEPNFTAILLEFAKRTGAPLADLLDSAAEYLAQLKRQREELVTAMSTPRATARVMALLPFVALFTTELLGFGNLRTLFSPAGFLILAVAALLVWLGQRWSRHILAISQPTVPPGLLVMLTIAGLRAGLELETVRFEAWRQLERGADRKLESEQEQIDAYLKHSYETGASVVEILKGLLAQIQHETSEKSRREVQQRAVRLMLPLGLTGLPAFMLVSVAPMLLRWLAA